MIRDYVWRGGQYRFHDGDAPDGAVLIEAKEAVAPANKARKAPANKGATSASGRSRGNPKPTGKPAQPAND